MNCFRCNTPLTGLDFCPACKSDVRVYKKIIGLSNAWYNEGLSLASSKNLTGAKACLIKSLKYNKMNINARNLLGLVYYETGRVVEALNEWNISDNIHPMANAASRYLAEFSHDPHVLEKVRQSVNKYNTAVEYALAKSDDLALIQLDKALSMNNHMVDAYKLLALILIKQKDYLKARKILKRAYQIDKGDPDIIEYVNEAKSRYAGAIAELKQQPLYIRIKYAWNIRRSKTFSGIENKRIKKAIPQILYVILGFVIGLSTALGLILPAREAVWKADYHERENQLYQTLAIPDVTEAPTPEPTPAITPVPANFADMVLANGDVFGYKSQIPIAEGTEAVSVFNSGTQAWESQDYEKCKLYMQQVLIINDGERDTASYMNALYYLAHCYEKLNDLPKALTVYSKTIELYPGTTMAENAQERINTLNE